MKKFLSVLLVLSMVVCVFAQQSESVSLSDPDPSIIGADSARQALKEVSVDLFEREGAWKARISPDCGIISARLFDGAPAAKEPIEDAGNQQLTDEKVLGVKVEFFRRGVNSFFITSARPLAIEGVTKTVSFEPSSFSSSRKKAIIAAPPYPGQVDALYFPFRIASLEALRAERFL